MRGRPRGVAGRVAATVAAATFVACGGGSSTSDADMRAFFAGADCSSLALALDQSDLGDRIGAGTDPTADLERSAAFFARARRAAPAELREDVAVLATAYSRLADEAGAVDWAAIRRGDPAATIPASRLSRHLADADFGRAAHVVGLAAEEHCRR